MYLSKIEYQEVEYSRTKNTRNFSYREEKNVFLICDLQFNSVERNENICTRERYI